MAASPTQVRDRRVEALPRPCLLLPKDLPRGQRAAACAAYLWLQRPWAGRDTFAAAAAVLAAAGVAVVFGVAGVFAVVCAGTVFAAVACYVQLGDLHAREAVTIADGAYTQLFSDYSTLNRGAVSVWAHHLVGVHCGQAAADELGDAAYRSAQLARAAFDTGFGTDGMIRAAHRRSVYLPLISRYRELMAEHFGVPVRVAELADELYGELRDHCGSVVLWDASGFPVSGNPEHAAADGRVFDVVAATYPDVDHEALAQYFTATNLTR